MQRRRPLAGIAVATASPAAFAKALVDVALTTPLLPDGMSGGHAGEWKPLENVLGTPILPNTVYTCTVDGHQFSLNDIVYFDGIADEWKVIRACSS